jgi:hypothetical protein
VLALSALLAQALGMVTIFSLPVDVRLRAFAATVLALWGGAQWLLITSAHKRYRRVRIDSDGTAALLHRGGEWHAAIICDDSIVLANYAWLKLKPAPGGTYCELMRAVSSEDKQWRRLQVIWRHLGTAHRSC